MEWHQLEGKALEVQGLEAQQSIGPSSLGTSGDGCATGANGSSVDEDETQLAAIRELMQRAFARGVWLTLGEIAEVTEFAEASISAQLRHLRKPHHGGHRVEKRRRISQRAAAATREIRAARRGPVIWEYRVMPKRSRGVPRGKSAAAPAGGAVYAAQDMEKTDSPQKHPERKPRASGDFFERQKQNLAPGTSSE